MSLQDITIDLDNLSFEIPRRPTGNNFDGSIYKEVVPPAITIQRAVKNRNRRCMPSDDEESEDEDDDDQSILSNDENDFSPTPRVQPALRSNTPVAVSVPAKKPIRKSQPLPSDDEDSEDDEDDEEEDEETNQNNVSKKHNQRNMQNNAYQPVQINTAEDLEEDDDDNEALLANRDPNAGPVLTLVEGSHLQQLHQMQQYHQQKLALFQNQIQPSKSNSSNIRRQQHGNGGRTMSGMDLLVQLEQEKADAKRMKPKVVHKLEGLLGRLPEPGSHNISFQQVQQQQQQQQQHQRTMQTQHHYYQQQQQQQQQQRGYLDPNIQQQLHHHHYQQQQQMQLQQQLQLQQQQQQQAYHYNTSRSPSPIPHRSLSPNPQIRSPSPNTRTQPHRNNRIHN